MHNLTNHTRLKTWFRHLLCCPARERIEPILRRVESVRTELNTSANVSFQFSSVQSSSVHFSSVHFSSFRSLCMRLSGIRIRQTMFVKPGFHRTQRMHRTEQESTQQTHVCMDRHHGTSPITSLQPSKLHLDIGYVPPTDTGSLCLAVDSSHTAVGLFRLLVRRSGTHCQMNSRDPACGVDSFKQFFKTILFSSY